MLNKHCVAVPEVAVRRRKRLPLGEVPMHCVCHVTIPSNADAAGSTATRTGAKCGEAMRRGIDGSEHDLTKSAIIMVARSVHRRRVNVNFRRGSAGPLISCKNGLIPELRLRRRWSQT